MFSQYRLSYPILISIITSLLYLHLITKNFWFGGKMMCITSFLVGKCSIYLFSFFLVRWCIWSLHVKFNDLFTKTPISGCNKILYEDGVRFADNHTKPDLTQTSIPVALYIYLHLMNLERYLQTRVSLLHNYLYRDFIPAYFIVSRDSLGGHCK